MSDDNGAVKPPQHPVMAVVDVEAWGVAPDGERAQIVIQTATQKITMALEFETMVNLSVVLKAAIFQSRRNARTTTGSEMAQAVQVNKFSVGHAKDVEGALLVIDPEQPSETVYVMPDVMALAMGKMLMAEGQRSLNLAKVLNGAIEKPAPRKIITPRGVH